jgi:hypothetical protein
LCADLDSNLQRFLPANITIFDALSLTNSLQAQNVVIIFDFSLHGPCFSTAFRRK